MGPSHLTLFDYPLVICTFVHRRSYFVVPSFAPMSRGSGGPRDKKWRQTWRTAALRVDFSRPINAVFAKAESVLLDPDRDVCDKRCAALAGVPQQVSPELCLVMWIPARDLSSTFSDTEIMTSLGSSTQSLLCTESLANLRDFKIIRNAGFSFICTDREVCTKLED